VVTFILLIIMLICLTYLTVLSVVCNTTVCEFPSLHVSAYCCQCRLSTKVSWFLQLSPAVNNALLGSGNQDPSLLLLQTVLTFSTTCRSTKSTNNLLLLQETCLLLCKMQLSKLTVKPLMMTILRSPTLLTLKHHKWHQT